MLPYAFSIDEQVQIRFCTENHAVDNDIFALLCMGHPNDEIIRKI